MTLTALTFMATLLIPSALCAQQNPLPEELEAEFSMLVADILLFDLGSGKSLVGDVTFDNMEGTQSVFIRWISLSDDGAYPGSIDKEYTLSFKPTAVCREVGRDGALYVVGWNERSGSIVVEKWTFAPTVFGQTMSPQTGSVINLASAPTLTRSHYSTFPSIAPAKGVVFNKYGGDVLLMIGDPADEIVSVTEGLGPVTLFSASGTFGTQIIGLDEYHSMKACVHQTLGFVITLTTEYSWNAPLGGPFYPDNDNFILLEDSDLDGIFDVMQSVPIQDYYTVVGQGLWVQDCQ